MDKKLIMTAAIVVAFLLASAILVTFYNPTEDDKEINLVARVNTEGSGIYIDPTHATADEYLSIDDDGKITYYADGWRGKVFGTPGSTSIQHMQLQSIVVNEIGLKFLPYDTGASGTDCVYYVNSVANAAAYASMPVLDGAIIWQPQYQAALDSDVRPAVKLLTTDEFDPGHTCCVIAAQHKYLQNNPALTVRFLAAYIKGVDWVNNALEDKSSAEYAQLIQIANKRTGGVFDQEVLEAALDSVTYTYGLTSEEDTSTAPLMSLESAVEGLVNNFTSLGALKRTMSDLGFSSSHEFSQRFVNDGYLVQAMDFTPSASGYSKSNITVAVIAGDIHQIAVHVASELGYFDAYGLNVKFSSATNGAGVAEALQNGEADLGFLGAPPITTTVINGMLSHS